MRYGRDLIENANLTFAVVKLPQPLPDQHESEFKSELGKLRSNKKISPLS
jgi:hypothetical protein